MRRKRVTPPCSSTLSVYTQLSTVTQAVCRGNPFQNNDQRRKRRICLPFETIITRGTVDSDDDHTTTDHSRRINSSLRAAASTTARSGSPKKFPAAPHPSSYDASSSLLLRFRSCAMRVPASRPARTMTYRLSCCNVPQSAGIAAELN